MGNLLGAPITDKETHVGDGENLKFGLSSMQGWRVHMEDAHIAETNMYSLQDGTKTQLPGHALFAVFDGHGGTFAAEYAGKNLCRVLSKQPKWNKYASLSLATDKSSKGEKEKVEWTRQVLECLEQAFKEAFVEIDQEIGLAIQGNPHADADTPYNENDIDHDNNDNMQQDDGSDNDQADDNMDPMVKAQIDHARDVEARLAAEEGDNSGTTACVVLVTPEYLICANAGDSRAVFSKTTGRVIPLSYDHKPDDEDEERRIRAAGGYVAGGRVEGDLAVSRGLGDFRFKHIPTVLNGKNSMSKANAESSGTMLPQDQKVSPIPDIIVQNRNIQLDEFIIVACDGIWDVRSNLECVQEVANLFDEGESDLGLISEELLDRCLQLGSKDNMTALVVKFPAQRIAEDGGGVMARREERERLEQILRQGDDEDDMYDS